jgi:diadenosine tetraphosphate (Ap4A) HIT family hydrolase
MDCAFCDKINLDFRKFYENDLFVAMYNLRPFVEGHSIIFPKRHVDSLLKLDEKEKTSLVSFLDRTIFIALKYAEAYQFDLILQEGEMAGQSVPHVHFHVMPRKAGDDVAKSKSEWLQSFQKTENDIRKNLSKEETQRAVDKLRFIAKEYALQLETL